jgi:hypothetical protein
MDRGLFFAVLALYSSMVFSSVTLTWNMPVTREDGTALASHEIMHTVINYECGRQSGEIIAHGESYELHVYGDCVFTGRIVDVNNVSSEPSSIAAKIAPPAPEWVK